MKQKPWKRILPMLLLVALMVGILPSAMADNEPDIAAEESELEGSPSIAPPEQEFTDEPTSEDGLSLTRLENDSEIMTLASTGTMTKTDCVYFSSYTSPYWTCSNSSHNYQHYYYAASIAYHKIDGEYAYCIEPNTSSAGGQTYSSYSANSAANSSYWMLELNDTQRTYIKEILAYSYPYVNRGYSQYAATQTLIWEAKCRSSNIQSCSDSGLYSRVYAVLGSNYKDCYDGILADIANGFSDGTVPSFAGSTTAKTIKLTLNTATNCYEASVTDTNGVLSHFDFEGAGVNFTRNGNTLNISVPASQASLAKGQIASAISDQKNLNGSNPTIWENATYQTVVTAGGAGDTAAYIELDWDDEGSLELHKNVTDSSIDVSGWEFTFRNNDTGEIVTKTTDSQGIITLDGLAAGSTYTVSEKSYDGYLHPADQTVTVQAGETTVITFTNEPLVGNLELSKSVNYGGLSGFQFRLYGTSTIGKSVDVTVTTDADGKASFRNIYVGTYTLEEVDPGDAYLPVSSQTVTITANETTGAANTAAAGFSNTWKYWHAAVEKVDAETGEAQGDASLDGAEFTLYKSGTAVATYTIQDGCFVTDSYPCTEDDGVYTLKETKAGYQLNSTVFQLATSYGSYSEAGNNITLTVSDESIYGKIEVQKWAVNTVSGEQKAEEGATFQVWLKSAGSYNNAKDSERDVIAIGKDGKGTSKDLPYGTYCVQQTSGWYGYDADETVYEVLISENGKTVTVDTSGNDLIVHNNIWTGAISIVKVDGDSREPLEGAELMLTGTDGSRTVLTTGEDGTVTFEDLVYGVTYTWAETKAPKGYSLNEDNTGTWSVEKHDDSIEISCNDFRIPGAITVTKENSEGSPLSGVVYLLEYLDGDTWKPVFYNDTGVLTPGGTSSPVENGRLTTDSSGIVTFEGLWADDELQYRLTEVEAPEGYSLLAEPIFEGVLPVSYRCDAAHLPRRRR